MKLDAAVDRAHKVSGPKEAARHYNNLEYELALGEHPPEHERQGEEALKVLEHRFPDVQKHAREVEEPPRLSRRAGERLRADSTRARQRVAQRRGSHRSSSQRPVPPRPPSRRERAGHALGLAGTGAGAVASATGADDWGSLLTELVLWGIGLSALYVLLTHAKGPSKLALGATNVVRGIVSPAVDPLNPRGL